MIATNRRRTMGKIGLPADIIMTTETNPEVLSVCYSKGWCKNSNYMTAREAAKITDIGIVFQNNTSIKHFDELQYFHLSVIEAAAFKQCSNLTSITLPNTISAARNQAFYKCSKLAKITINKSTAPWIGSNTFFSVANNGTLYVPTGSTGYETWMGTGNYYLGKYNWTKVEQ